MIQNNNLLYEREKQEETCVILRSCGERTEELCKYSILKNNIKEKQVFTIKNITPFSRALKESYKLALEINKKYTFFVDADMILLEDAFSTMLSIMNRLPDNVFFVNPLVYDYITGYIQPNGPHLYKTRFLEKAINLIPHETISLRPETDTIKKMRELGFEPMYLDLPLAFHEFEQYYSSIFQRTLNKYYKAKSKREYLSKRFKKLSGVNEDFKVARLALDYAENHNFPLKLDYQQFDSVFEKYDIKEKNTIRNLENVYADLMKSIPQKKAEYIYRGYTQFLLDSNKRPSIYRRVKNILNSISKWIKKKKKY